MALAGHPSEILPGVPRTLSPAVIIILSVVTLLAWLPVSRCLHSPLQGGADSSFLLASCEASSSTVLE